MDTSDFNAQTECSISLKKAGKRESKRVRAMVLGLWKEDQVGYGRDARGLDEGRLKDHDDIEITSIERLDNTNLREKYKMYKKQIKKCATKRHQRYPNIENLSSDINGHIIKSRSVETDKSGKGIFSSLKRTKNEHFLLHGCSQEASRGILENGFDPKLTDPQAMFGQGIYFAENPTKADQYTGNLLFSVL